MDSHGAVLVGLLAVVLIVMVGMFLWGFVPEFVGVIQGIDGKALAIMAVVFGVVAVVAYALGASVGVSLIIGSVIIVGWLCLEAGGY